MLVGISLITGCFSKSRLKMGTTDEGEVVEATGMAPHDSSDLLRTKRASLTDAQRNAVEKAVGVFVSARALNEQAIQIENNILAQTEGYIKKYDILKENVDGVFYKTKIRALVAIRDLEADLKKMSLLRSPELVRPRVQIVLSENIDQYANEQKPTSTMLSKELIKKGYVIVSENPDLEIQGSVVAHPFQASGLGGFVSYRARAEVKVLNAGTKEIVCSHIEEASGLGGSAELAGLKALETVGELLAEKLNQQIEDSWIQRRHLLAFVENVQNFDQVDRVKKHIESQPGVQSVVLRRYDEGMAQYEIEVGDLGSMDLARRMEKSKTVHMTVLETHPQTIHLKLHK